MTESTDTRKERALLAGLCALSMDQSERSSDVTMEELAALVETAGGEVVVTLIQNRPSPDPEAWQARPVRPSR